MADPTTGTPDPSTTGGFNFGDLIKGFLNLAPGSNGSNPGVGLALPAWALAYKQWQDANQYQDVAKTASDLANPAGDRSYYVNRLRQSYDDPSAILNDPGHQIQVKRGLDAVGATDAMKGYLGSGNMAVDLSKYASDSDATYLDQERKTLGNLGGFQFDPANAAGMLMKGNDEKIASQNNALSTMMLPFMANMSQNRLNNNNPNANQPLDPNTIKTITQITNPDDMARQIAQLATQSGSSAADLIKQILSTNDISPSTANILNQMSQDPQYADLFNTGGGVDQAPPGNNNGNPFGPGEDVPDWLKGIMGNNPNMFTGGTPDFNEGTGNYDSFFQFLDSLGG